MDWIRFLEDNRIPYVSRGPNTAKGEVSIHCPWCGADDPSEHLGIALDTGYWGCLRDPAHRGKGPEWLVRGLLSCSKHVAQSVVAQYSQADPDYFDQINALGATAEAPEAALPLVWPREFKPIDGLSGSRFSRYLEGRGFDAPVTLAREYDLHYCTTGRWKDRIIFLVYQCEHALGWTGRALGNPVNAPRYLTEGNIKEALYLEDLLCDGGRLLFITEGPLDALKIDYYGKYKGVRATCTFGTSTTLPQICTLRKLSPRFDKTILLLDPDAVAVAYDLIEWLPNVVFGQLPENVEDPGAMDKDQVMSLAAFYL